MSNAAKETHSPFTCHRLRRYVALVGAVLLLTCSQTWSAPDTGTLRGWISDMKTSSRGPFSRIRWFCADGQVLAPKAYACVPYGGGVQHGELNQRAQTLRANGYFVANVLAGLDPEAFLAQEDAAERFKQILIEQFLVRTDDGWILRKARYYRGALQEEDERRAARQLLLEMMQHPQWLDRGFVVLRAGARFLAHGDDGHTITRIRERVADLSERDPAFEDLKNKIHIQPDAGDAEAVRAYARHVSDPALAKEYRSLAELVDQVYSPSNLSAQLQSLANLGRRHPLLSRTIKQSINRLATSRQAEVRFTETAALMAKLREMLSGPYAPELRLAMLDTSLVLEAAHFAAATELNRQLANSNRAQRIAWLRTGIQAAHGAGLLSGRQHESLNASLSRLASDTVTLATYKRELDYLALVPSWAERQLQFHFQQPAQQLTTIEPLAGLFVHDMLRGGPLLFYSSVLDGLLRDANRLSGVHKTLFGREVGAGIRALNPGIAQGPLHLAPASQEQDFSPDGIYILAETTSSLPPVAGVITAGEGNLLSHVQLLARNLGIPNVVVDSGLIPELSRHAGRRVLLAVSPAGSVQLTNAPPQSAETPGRISPDDIRIQPDLNKLDLQRLDLIRLSDLRSGDSGRIVGPKAAKLGELQHHFPEVVADGLAIPFGIFRKLLEQPYPGSGLSMFEWMRGSYRRLEALPEGSTERSDAAEALRREIHAWILAADPGPAFRTRLREAMAKVFGRDGSYGVFVRSDTNIEDLPGFSGAGLNLTVPHVVGYEEIFAAVRRVWASPFSKRAFAWRQGRMPEPEHVYPAVLLMRTVPVDKSGVMVTRDLGSGDPGWLSVAVNEGMGGVVDGQAAESLRIDRNTGEAQLLAQATAPWKRAPGRDGGIEKIPASGSDAVLQAAEIEQLVQLARDLPARFPPILDAHGHATAVDIEFGFLRGKLALFQIRPFLESRSARSNEYLKALDERVNGDNTARVDLRALPGVEP